MRSSSSRAFTLVEILIVVVILGILAAIVIGEYVGVTADAQIKATYGELQKIRSGVGVYRARNYDANPPVTAGDGTWGPLVSRDYFLSAPINAWVGGDNASVIVLGNEPDTTYQRSYGWIFDPISGQVWAGGFDANDQPLPRN